MLMYLIGHIRNGSNNLIELLTSRCNLIEPSTNGDNIRIIAVIASACTFIYALYRLLKRKQTDEETDPNLAFYRNLIPSVPDGDKIEIILTDWRGNYDLLERHHGYIQWLFPNRDPGVNPEASTLTDKEAETIRESPVLRRRVKESFKMMLDFYGMELTLNDEFKLAENHLERLAVLNYWGNHNFLRISRILLALKELGHKELMLPWLKFLAKLIYVEHCLDKAESSFENYWIRTLGDSERRELRQYIDSENFRNKKDDKKEGEDSSDKEKSSSGNRENQTHHAKDGENTSGHMVGGNNKKEGEDSSDKEESSSGNCENQTHHAKDGGNTSGHMVGGNNKKEGEDSSDKEESSSGNCENQTHHAKDGENTPGHMVGGNNENNEDK